MKISEAYNNYAVDCLRMKGKSESTVSHYAYARESAIDFFGNIEIEEIDLEGVRKYYIFISRGRKSNTIRNYMGCLRSVLKYARIQGSPCLNAELVPVAKREETFVSCVTPEEVEKMISAAKFTDNSIRNKFIISFLYASGVRLSEFRQLNRDSVQKRSFSVRGKGGKIRVCFIDERTEYLMGEYLKTRSDRLSPLVLSRQGGRISASTVQRIIHEICRLANVDKNVTPHTFRHGYATNLLSNRVPIQDVAQLLGHASIKTTMIYFHNTNSRLQEQYERGHTV